jgi:hypothetical protein
MMRELSDAEMEKCHRCHKIRCRISLIRCGTATGGQGHRQRRSADILGTIRA